MKVIDDARSSVIPEQPVWLKREAHRLAAAVRSGDVDHELALEVGLEDILNRHFRAARYPLDTDGHAMPAPEQEP